MRRSQAPILIQFKPLQLVVLVELVLLRVGSVSVLSPLCLILADGFRLVSLGKFGFSIGHPANDRMECRELGCTPASDRKTADRTA